jgi:ATP-dependent RNA helicase DDX49/DBP8
MSWSRSSSGCAIPFLDSSKISREVKLQQQRPYLYSTMSSIDSESENEALSASSSSNVDSGSDVDSPEETPKKRRRISPPAKESNPILTKASAPSLSRIKAKKPVVTAQKSKESEDAMKSLEIEDSVSTTTVKLEKTTFANIDVHLWLVRSLANMAITRPTGIQKGCIPEILKGRDCIGGSRTGSGKTVAFAVPILQKWAEDPIGIFAVILTPTRYVNLINSER